MVQAQNIWKRPLYRDILENPLHFSLCMTVSHTPIYTSQSSLGALTSRTVGNKLRDVAALITGACLKFASVLVLYHLLYV